MFFLVACSSFNKMLTKDDISFMKECIETTDKTYTYIADSSEIEASKKDVCYDILADRKSDYNYCNTIKMSELKSDCFFRFATALKDEDLCQFTNAKDKCLLIVNLKPLSPEDIKSNQLDD